MGSLGFKTGGSGTFCIQIRPEPDVGTGLRICSQGLEPYLHPKGLVLGSKIIVFNCPKANLFFVALPNNAARKTLILCMVLTWECYPY